MKSLRLKMQLSREKKTSKKRNRQSINQQLLQCLVKLDSLAMMKGRRNNWQQNPKRMMKLKILMKIQISLSQRMQTSLQSNRVNCYATTYLKKLEMQRRAKGPVKTVDRNSALNSKKKRILKSQLFQIFLLLMKKQEEMEWILWPYLQVRLKTMMVKNSKNQSYLEWSTGKIKLPQVQR